MCPVFFSVLRACWAVKLVKVKAWSFGSVTALLLLMVMGDCRWPPQDIATEEAQESGV